MGYAFSVPFILSCSAQIAVQLIEKLDSLEGVFGELAFRPFLKTPKWNAIEKQNYLITAMLVLSS